jgi:thiol:disulfide interchange protein DsbD
MANPVLGSAARRFLVLAVWAMPAALFGQQADAKSASADSAYVQHVQPTTLSRGETKPTPIRFEIALSPTNAGPGENVTLSIKAILEPGYHTFSLTQNGIGGSPTEITLDAIEGLTPTTEGFEADRPFEVHEEAGGILQELYHDEVNFRRAFAVQAGIPSGSYSVSGHISLQYCNAKTCTPLAADFAVGQSTPPAPVAVELPDAAAPPAAAGVAVVAPEAKALAPFLLACLAGGFLALLLPCSYPMVPITVSFFLKQSEREHKRPWLLALVYCGTIVAAFTILGVGIAFLFGATKLNDLANISWLNFAIGGVFVLFALNMLGLFDIHMPGWLLTMTASKESAGSYIGAIFMALTFTLTSFTCTAAIAGGLLLTASHGEITRPALGMLAFGTAFAAPFFILAMMPGLLKKIPKSGGWMNSVKVVLGLLELGAAVKFFSIADPGQVVFEHVAVMLIWFVLAIVTAVYLFGWFRLPHDTAAEHISPWSMLLGILFFVMGGLLLVGVTMPERGGFLVRQVLAFAPLRSDLESTPLGPTNVHHGLKFALYFDKAIPVARKENKPLLLDFTGVNCQNCRIMELKMAQAAWKKRIENFIGVQLYVDVPQIPGIPDVQEGRQLQLANVRRQLEMVQDASMPSYAIATPDGKTVLATYIGAETVPGTFVEFLDEGWKKWESLQVANGAAPAGAIQLAGEK